MENEKKLGLVHIFGLLKSGLNPAEISKKYKIPKQTLNYSVDKLKRQGCIEKIGYGTWNCIKPPKRSTNLTSRHSSMSNTNFGTSFRTSSTNYRRYNLKKEIRGHAFIWKIEFVEPYDWKKAVKKTNFSFQSIKNDKILRTIFQGRKIWLGKKGLTIYEPLDFFGSSSYEVKGKAVFEMDLLIKNLLKKLNLKFKPYRFTTSREHYGIIKNQLARQYNDKKEKMQIRSEDGTLWMWIDDSLSLGELENNEPNINRQVQNYWNNHKKHKFQVDADFILNVMSEQGQAVTKNAENLDQYARHLKSHVKSIQDLGNGINSLVRLIKKLDLK